MSCRTCNRGLAVLAVVTLTSMFTSRTAIAACPGFATAVNKTASSAPASVAIGDFNGDGNLDLAVANASGAANDVSVFLATGSGTFANAVNYAAGSGSSAIVTADFNRDGRLDLAVANNGSDDVSILLGNGNGTFGTASSVGADAGPVSLAADDFNRDGKLDLAVANASGNDVIILLGDGAGAFTFNGAFSGDDGVNSVAAADFNNDGIIDLAVANTISNDISILPGLGDGTFDSANNSGAINGVESVAVGDFNRDGNADVAVPTGLNGNVDVAILVGDGAFGLSPAAYFPVDDVPTFAAVGDFNGDGRPDLAVADSGGSIVSILLGQGNGAFAAAVAIGAHASPSWVAVGDLNNDGRADLAVANRNSGDVSILLNNGTCANFANFCGRFGTLATFTVGSTPQGLAVADFNDDGRLDAAVANSASNNVSILLGSGVGNLVSAGAVSVGTAPTAVATGDFNRDGIVDLAVANFGSQNYSILTGNGLGGFSVTGAFLGFQARDVKVADFNRDGIDDLMFAGSTGTLQYAAGLGNGTFAATVRAGFGTADNFVAVGDVNGDGKLDYVAANSFLQTIVVDPGNGDGTFGSPTSNSVGGTPASLTLADFDRDGDLDIAAVSIQPDQLSIFINNGGTFAAPAIYDAGRNPLRVIAGDFDGDGRLDLAVTKNSTNGRGISVLRGVGNGTFELAVPYATNYGVWGIAAADFNRDGRTDILAANYNSATESPSTTVSLLLNACPTGVDLTINKIHDGTSFQVGTPGTYRIAVSNIGGPATNGTTVTVNDALPTGMSATTMTGTGWTCNPAAAACTTTDVLPGASSYPTITLTVSMDNSTVSPSINTASVSGGGDANAGNNSANDSVSVLLPAPPAPANLVAETSAADGFVHLTWDPAPRSDFYTVTRSTNGVDFSFLNNSLSPSYVDTNFTSDTTYFYKVQGVNNGGAGPTSNRDYATTTVFTEDPLGNTIAITLAHLEQLRKAVNGMHNAAGLGDITYADPIAPGLRVKASHIIELRTALDAARTQLVLSPVTYANTVASNALIRAADFQEIRDAVK